MPKVDIKERILGAGKRFVPTSAGFMLPAIEDNLTVPVSTKACSQRILQDKCRRRPTPRLCKIPRAPELSVYNHITVRFPVIQLTRRLKRMASEVPLEHA